MHQKLLFIFVTSLFLVSCGSNDSPGRGTITDSTATEEISPTDPPAPPGALQQESQRSIPPTVLADNSTAPQPVDLGDISDTAEKAKQSLDALKQKVDAMQEQTQELPQSDQPADDSSDAAKSSKGSATGEADNSEKTTFPEDSLTEESGDEEVITEDSNGYEEVITEDSNGYEEVITEDSNGDEEVITEDSNGYEAPIEEFYSEEIYSDELSSESD